MAIDEALQIVARFPFCRMNWNEATGEIAGMEGFHGDFSPSPQGDWSAGERAGVRMRWCFRRSAEVTAAFLEEAAAQCRLAGERGAILDAYQRATPEQLVRTLERSEFPPPMRLYDAMEVLRVLFY